MQKQKKHQIDPLKLPKSVLRLREGSAQQSGFVRLVKGQGLASLMRKRSIRSDNIGEARHQHPWKLIINKTLSEFAQIHTGKWKLSCTKKQFLYKNSIQETGNTDYCTQVHSLTSYCDDPK